MVTGRLVLVRFRPKPIGFLSLALAILTLTGCTITPIEQVSSPTPVPADGSSDASNDSEPETLAFAAEGPDLGATLTRESAPDALLLDDGRPGAWAVATETARLGVHSAPDHVFTRLGVVGPGQSVLATGRRVETNGAGWMEIRWADSTAWVIEAGFTPTD